LKIYLASPLGFTEEGRLYIKKRLVPMLREKGFVLMDPWLEEEKKNTKNLLKSTRKEVLNVSNRNLELIRKSDIILANLNGADQDSGTSAEIGYAYALGKTIIGYRTDFRYHNDLFNGVNAQVYTIIYRSGGKIFSNIEEAIKFVEKLKVKPHLR